MIQIVGVDHWLQEYELWTRREYILGEPSEEELVYRRASKNTFYDLLEAFIKRGDFALVAEECRQGQHTIPKQLASENGLGYVEIDMNAGQRERAGIRKDYDQSEDTKETGYALREDWMVERTIEALCDPKGALVICGATHIEGLRMRFLVAGKDVETLDITQEKWAKNPILKSRDEGFD